MLQSLLTKNIRSESVTTHSDGGPSRCSPGLSDFSMLMVQTGRLKLVDELCCPLFDIGRTGCADDDMKHVETIWRLCSTIQ